MQSVFTDIYRNGKWHNGSGSGSEPKNVTDYLAFLQEYLHKHTIKSVLDLGCGDWKFSHLIDWKGISYLGVDVVPHIIEENKKKYSSDTIKFLCKDVGDLDLPGADLIIIKDVLQHWPNQQIHALKPKLSKYPHVLIINTIRRYHKVTLEDISVEGKMVNDDIETGEFRPLDLTQPPFSWPGHVVYRYSFTRPGLQQEEVGIIELRNQP